MIPGVRGLGKSPSGVTESAGQLWWSAGSSEGPRRDVVQVQAQSVGRACSQV